MLTGIWTSFLLSLIGVATVAWLVALTHESGVRPLRGLVAFFRKQPMAGRILFGTFFVAMRVIAGTKPGGGAGRPALPEASSAGRDVLPEGNSVGRDVPVAPDAERWADFAPITSTNTARTLMAEDFAHGFVMHRIGTDEAFGFAVPPGATVCADWEAFGAAEDWIYLSFTNWAFRVGTNEASRFRVLSFGRVDFHANHPYTSLQTRVGMDGGALSSLWSGMAFPCLKLRHEILQLSYYGKLRPSVDSKSLLCYNAPILFEWVG